MKIIHLKAIRCIKHHISHWKFLRKIQDILPKKVRTAKAFVNVFYVVTLAC